MQVTTKPSFFSYLHSFRGFAILNIVAVHTLFFVIFMSTGSFNPKQPLSIVNELLFHNSTIYFAVISGMLYTAVLHKKGYKAFFLSKFKYVFLPYVFFTLAYSLFDNTSQDWFALQPTLKAYLKELPRNFIYGKANFVFWYISVLLFLYIITPLLHYLMGIKKWGNWIFSIIIFIPIFVRRAEVAELMASDFISFKNMIYFTGAYAAGMFIANNMEARLIWLHKFKWIIAGISIISSAGILYAMLNDINRFGFFSLESALFYVQKMALAVIALIMFRSLGDKQPKWLNPVAKNAFTIYFVHSFLLAVVILQLMPFIQYQKIAPFNIIIACILALTITILLSLLFAWIIRKLFGKYSRMLIGS